MDNTEIYIGSGNVFADMGLPHPEELQLKADLAIQIRRLVQAKHLSDPQAAQQLDMDTAEYARLQNNPLADFTLDRLFHCLNRLGHSIEVRLSPEETDPGKARTLLVAA